MRHGPLDLSSLRQGSGGLCTEPAPSTKETHTRHQQHNTTPTHNTTKDNTCTQHAFTCSLLIGIFVHTHVPPPKNEHRQTTLQTETDTRHTGGHRKDTLLDIIKTGEQVNNTPHNRTTQSERNCTFFWVPAGVEESHLDLICNLKTETTPKLPHISTTSSPDILCHNLLVCVCVCAHVFQCSSVPMCVCVCPCGGCRRVEPRCVGLLCG